jgi:hypothetical protein
MTSKKTEKVEKKTQKSQLPLGEKSIVLLRDLLKEMAKIE